MQVPIAQFGVQAKPNLLGVSISLTDTFLPLIMRLLRNAKKMATELNGVCIVGEF